MNSIFFLENIIFILILILIIINIINKVKRKILYNYYFINL